MVFILGVVVNFGLVSVKVEHLIGVVARGPGEDGVIVGRIGLKVCRGGNITGQGGEG